MKYHSDDEKELIESFRAAGGKRIFFRRRCELQLSPSMTKALARLVRSGHVTLDSSGDFNWVCYELREAAEDKPNGA
jgi:hypothetical protein